MREDDMYILDKKVREFNEMITEFKNNNSIDLLQLKEELYDLLGHFEVCFNIKKITKRYEDITDGIRFANNVRKHSRPIFKHSLHTTNKYSSNNLQPGNHSYPTEFRIWWNKLPLLRKDNDKDKHKYKCYNKKLLNNDILETINQVYKIVKEAPDYYNH